MSSIEPGLRVTRMGIVANLALGAVKVAGGFALGSKALIADGVHSLLDLLSDLAVLFGLLMARRPGDESHPYGHHKFASFAKLTVGGLLVFFSCALLVAAVASLRGGVEVPKTGPAIWIVVFAIAVKEALFRITRAVARRTKSGLLMANAWHHRSDCISSVGVLAALVGVWIGGPAWAFLDPLLTVVLGAYLLFESVKILREAIRDLLDTAPKREIIDHLREHILPVPGAVAYHEFRTRRVGDVYEVDLHLQVDPSITVEAGHAIAKQVKERLMEKHPEVTTVLVHIEPADAKHMEGRGVHGGGGHGI